MSAPPSQPEVNVLAIDDEQVNSELMERAFRARAGFHVTIARSGEEALQFLAQHPVDVLLVDQAMPGMSGVEFLREAARLMPNAVSIMVTAYPELQEVMEAQNEGLVGHIIAKPWRMDELVSVIERAIRMRDMRQAVKGMKTGRE